MSIRRAVLARLRPLNNACTAQSLQQSERGLAIQPPPEPQARGDGSESDWEASEHSQQAAEEPPGIFATVGLMGFGAIGAVAVSVLGVMAVFQMANTVAAGTGRTIMAGKESEQSALTEAEKKLEKSVT